MKRLFLVCSAAPCTTSHKEYSVITWFLCDGIVLSPSESQYLSCPGVRRGGLPPAQAAVGRPLTPAEAREIRETVRSAFEDWKSPRAKRVEKSGGP